MRFSANYIVRSARIMAYDINTSGAILSYTSNSNGAFTLTANTTLDIIATCQATSADGGVIGEYGKIILNPQF